MQRDLQHRLPACNFGVDVEKTGNFDDVETGSKGVSPLYSELQTLRVSNPSNSRTFDTRLSPSPSLSLSSTFPFPPQERLILIHDCSRSYTPRYTLSSARSSSHTDPCNPNFLNASRPSRKEKIANTSPANWEVTTSLPSCFQPGAPLLARVFFKPTSPFVPIPFQSLSPLILISLISNEQAISVIDRMFTIPLALFVHISLSLFLRLYSRSP